MKLTAANVAALALPDGKNDIIYFDETMAGFGYRLRRSHDGSKMLRSWIVQYKRAGASRRVLLGSAEVLSAEAARTAAKKLLSRIVLGEDPAADRADRREKDKLSLRSQVEQYLALKAREVRPKTLREITRYLTGPYLKPLHSVALDMIGRKDVASRLGAIQREHGDIVAKAARDKLSAFYVWAMQEGLIEANPVIGTRAPQGNKPHDRVLSNVEFVAIWNACKDDDYGKIIKLLILTGCRRQEIGGMRWSEFGLDGPQPSWTLPAERSKNGKAHTLPLMPMALAIIKGVPRMVSRDQLFGSRSGAGFASWDRDKAALNERSGVTNWTPHDIRRSVTTKMAGDIGVLPHVIEQILNHQSGHKSGPAGIYNRSAYEREVRNALALWEDHVRTLIEGGERKVIHIGAPHAPQAVP
jgi:integrase